MAASCKHNIELSGSIKGMQISKVLEQLSAVKKDLLHAVS
jgi:hypothetical protein